MFYICFLFFLFKCAVVYTQYIKNYYLSALVKFQALLIKIKRDINVARENFIKTSESRTQMKTSQFWSYENSFNNRYHLQWLIMDGIFPNIRKESKICPFLKKDDKSFIENYRSVVILCNFCNDFEMILVDKISHSPTHQWFCWQFWHA